MACPRGGPRGPPAALAYPAGSEYVDDTILDHLAKLTGRRRLPVGAAVGAPRRPERLVWACEATWPR